MTSFLASHQSFSLCWFMFVLVEPPSSLLIWKHKFDPLGVLSSLTIPANWSYPPNYHLAMSRCSIVSGQEWPVWLQVQFQGANSIFLCGTKDKVRVVRMLPCVCFTWKCAWQGARLVKVTIQVHTALWWWVAPVSLCCRSVNVLQSWCSDRWKFSFILYLGLSNLYFIQMHFLSDFCHIIFFTYTICVKTWSPWTLVFTLLSALSSYQELGLVFVFTHTHSSCLLCALNLIVYNFMIILYDNSDSDSADVFYHGIFLDDKSTNRTVTHPPFH